MARVKGPLFSMEASGTIGNTLVFSKWKGRDYVRRHAIPSNPKSGLQVGIRSVFGWIAQDYANLAAGDVTDWTALAAGDNVTPLNAHIRDAVDRARRNLGWRQNTTDSGSTTPNAPTSATATAQPKTLVLDWTDPATNEADYCIAIYRSVSTGFTPDISNLVGIVAVGVETFTDINLPAGTEQFYRARGINTDGVLGTLIAQFSGTPTS